MLSASANTEHCRLAHPYARTGMVVGGALAAAGVATLAPSAPDAVDAIRQADSWSVAWEEAAGAMLVSGLGALLLAFGLWMVLCMLRWQYWTNPPFRHAPGGTLPDVDTSPLDTNYFDTVSYLSHTLEEWAERCVLTPQDRRRRKIVALALYTAGFLAVVNILIFLAYDAESIAGPITAHIGTVLLGGSAVSIGALLIWHSNRRVLCTVWFDRTEDRWDSEHPHEQAAGSLSRIAAVQLCLHRIVQEAGAGGRRRHSARFQINLVTAAEADDREPYRRYVIVEAEMPVGQIARLAERLATFLDRPLLHHARQS